MQNMPAHAAAFPIRNIEIAQRPIQRSRYVRSRRASEPVAKSDVCVLARFLSIH